MSAIAGIVRLDGKRADQADLRRMMSALEMYGKDAQHSWQLENAAMARLLYRTTPEDEYDCQPLAANSLTLTFTGRIDNRDELAKALDITADRARLMADSDFAFAAFAKWREQSFSRLLGEFAIAIWDSQESKLYLCRDLSAGRPLYWHMNSKLIAFASMPKGLFALPEVPRQIDEARLADLMTSLPLLGQQSLFLNIQRVEPGHFVVLAQDMTHSVCFRKYDPAKRITFSCDDDYVEAYKERFEEAVRCRLRGNGGIASQLSSGFDSSTVTAVAATMLGERTLTSFTAVPREGFNEPTPKGKHADEWPGASALAARHANITHIPVRVKGAFLEKLDFHIASVERPIGSICNARWWRNILEEASSHEARILLCGVMGNMGLSWEGSSLLPELISQGRFVRWTQEASALRLAGKMGWKGILSNSFGHFIPQAIWNSLDKRGAALISLSSFSPINPKLLKSASIEERARDMGYDLSFRSSADSQVERCNVLRSIDVGDARMAALAMSGVEMRDPTADVRFMEYCLAIPEEQYMRMGKSRFLLKRAYGMKLPEKIMDAKTRGIQAADWHESATASLTEIKGLLDRLSNSLTAARCLDLDALNHLVENWPKDGWQQPDINSLYRMKVLRGLSVGAFILYAEG